MIWGKWFGANDLGQMIRRSRNDCFPTVFRFVDPRSSNESTIFGRSRHSDDSFRCTWAQYKWRVLWSPSSYENGIKWEIDANGDAFQYWSSPNCTANHNDCTSCTVDGPTNEGSVVTIVYEKAPIALLRDSSFQKLGKKDLVVRDICEQWPVM